MIKEVVYNGKTYTAAPVADEGASCRGCSFEDMLGSGLCAGTPCCKDDELDGEVLQHAIIWVEKQ